MEITRKIPLDVTKRRCIFLAMNDKHAVESQPRPADKSEPGGRGRGPSFPVWNLAEAIRRTGILFEHERG